MRWLLTVRIQEIILEIDNFLLFQGLLDLGASVPDLRLLEEEIMMLKGNFHFITFAYILESSNQVAVRLASYASHFPTFYSMWNDSPPDCIVDLLYQDAVLL